MDDQHDSATALTVSEDAVLVSLAADRNDAVAQALQSVYVNLPGEVVRQCERHRIGATSDYLRHMREVRDALAPYGALKQWCTVQCINFTALKTELSRRFGEVAPDTRATHSRRLENAVFSASLPAKASHPIVDSR